ncbi:bifunctional 4-hydroxyphenylacetate degradation enzyme [Ilyonectria robusta]
MGFQKLVRYEQDDNVHYGELLETSDDGFKVAKLNGSIADGFSTANAEPITVKKVTIIARVCKRVLSQLTLLAPLPTRADTYCSMHWSQLSSTCRRG